MYLFKKSIDLQKHLDQLRKQNLQIGFTPTMGALHQGHLSLVNKSLSKTDINVCSIFVNPTQFNEKSDLDKYPRTTSQDLELLTTVNNDIVWMPSVEDIYPKDLDTTIPLDFGQLDKVMEAAFRPGHFDGVAQVVKRLLDIVQPDQLFMGQKDFQQMSIIKNMIEQLGLNVELVSCPIIREADGLAMSSRNVRLTSEHRAKAPIIQQTLQWAKSQMNQIPPKEIAAIALERLRLPDFKLEYFEIVDGNTLLKIEKLSDSNFVVACTAVWLGEVRLIDNVIFKNES